MTAEGAVAEADGGEAGRAAEALLRAAVDRINTPVIDTEFMPAEAGDGIDDEECASAVDEFREAFQGLVGTGAGLGMDDGDEFGLGMLVERGG
jgi:hypothetical protein